MSTFSELFNLPDLEQELEISSSRSSGKGGQHVNTTETRVELHFNIPASNLLRAEQKELLMQRLGHRLSGDGNLRMYSQKSRSQSANKEEPVKVRVKTKPGLAVKEARLTDKKSKSQKKDLRKPPKDDY
jgi:ribosome-associated protein